MDKNQDFEKLVEQARFLSQLMNSGMNNSVDVEADEADGPHNSSEANLEYAGAFSSSENETVPDESDNQDAAYEKAIQAIKIFQALNQREQTSDDAPAYDNVSADNGFTEESIPFEDYESNTQKEDSGPDFSWMYDEMFTTPDIKAIKAAIRFVDPKYHKIIGLWIKFMEMQNMLQIYAKRAQSGHSRPEHADWRRGMLLSVRPHVSQEKQYIIDLLIKVMELKEIMSILGEMRIGG